MFAPLLLALVLVPLIEIYFLVQVGQEIGTPATILLLVVISILGAWLVKREGRATWNRLRAAMGRGEIPTKEAVDGAMILFGGALMLTPGFITDILGLLLILPPTRAALKGSFRRVLGTWVLTRGGVVGKAGRGVYAARVVGSRRKPRGSTGPVTPRSGSPSAPSLERPPDEGDSPGRA